MYTPPKIDETGMHIPTYTDIRDKLISDAKSIFGSDIYLEPDSQDYQWIATVSAMIYDTLLAAQAAYNSRGPSTAIGSGLDAIVAINGLKRKPGQRSAAYVTLTGTAGTSIASGVVQDINGRKWALSPSVTIGQDGKATALAICQNDGAVSAAPGEINRISTPTNGWSSVTNAIEAIVGTSVETDAELRARQAISTAQPSQSVVEGLRGALLTISGVKRLAVYENDTDATDTNGLPKHSITCVIEGGTDTDIAQEIFNRKTPGAYLNGSTPVQVTDQYGVQSTIRFSRPTYVDIHVTVSLKALTGYTSVTTDNIRSAVADYLNSLSIGDILTLSSLWGAALSVNEIPNRPSFSIISVLAARTGQTEGTSDIAIAYNEVTRGNITNIVVNVS